MNRDFRQYNPKSITKYRRLNNDSSDELSKIENSKQLSNPEKWVAKVSPNTVSSNSPAFSNASPLSGFARVTPDLQTEKSRVNFISLNQNNLSQIEANFKLISTDSIFEFSEAIKPILNQLFSFEYDGLNYDSYTELKNEVIESVFKQFDVFALKNDLLIKSNQQQFDELYTTFFDEFSYNKDFISNLKDLVLTNYCRSACSLTESDFHDPEKLTSLFTCIDNIDEIDTAYFDSVVNHYVCLFSHKLNLSKGEPDQFVYNLTTLLFNQLIDSDSSNNHRFFIHFKNRLNSVLIERFNHNANDFSFDTFQETMVFHYIKTSVNVDINFCVSEINLIKNKLLRHSSVELLLNTLSQSFKLSEFREVLVSLRNRIDDMQVDKNIFDLYDYFFLKMHPIMHSKLPGKLNSFMDIVEQSEINLIEKMNLQAINSEGILIGLEPTVAMNYLSEHVRVILKYIDKISKGDKNTQNKLLDFFMPNHFDLDYPLLNSYNKLLNEPMITNKYLVGDELKNHLSLSAEYNLDIPAPKVYNPNLMKLIFSLRFYNPGLNSIRNQLINFQPN